MQAKVNRLKQTSLQFAFLLCALVCATPYVSAPIALLTGFIFSLIFGNPLPRFSSKATSWLLKASVVGLGFGMNIEDAITGSKQALSLTVCSITLVLVAGYFLGKWMGINSKLTHLLSSGTAICGGSAIAAVAPVIDADKDQISVSLAVVFFLNSLALLIFPMLGHCLELSQYQFGLWSAIAIHDTSSVVGAAATYGDEALKIATTVKLTRALWIIPISLLSMFLFRSKNKKISIPWFIFLFVGAVILNSVWGLSEISSGIYYLSKNMLVVTLFLIGSCISFKSLRSTGIKSIGLGVGLWVLISVISLLAIMHL